MLCSDVGTVHHFINEAVSLLLHAGGDLDCRKITPFVSGAIGGDAVHQMLIGQGEMLFLTSGMKMSVLMDTFNVALPTPPMVRSMGTKNCSSCQGQLR